jgi:hypothetical protein
MAVYGNGNIHLKNFTPPADVASVHSLNGPAAGNSNNPTGPFSAFAANPYANSVQYRFDWGDGSNTTTNFYSDGEAATNIYHTWNTGGLFSVRVQAKTQNSAWSSWSDPIVVNIDNQPPCTLAVIAYDTYNGGYISPNVWIDGSWAGYAPLAVQVPPDYYSVTLDHYYGVLYLPWYGGLTDGYNSYNNGDFIPVYSDTAVWALYTLGG